MTFNTPDKWAVVVIVSLFSYNINQSIESTCLNDCKF